MTVKKINYKIFTSVLIAFLITILLFLLFFVFVYISFDTNNNILKKYNNYFFNYYSEFKIVMEGNYLNINLFYSLEYIAFGILGLAMLLPIFYYYSQKKSISFYQRKYLFVTWLIIALLFIVIFLFSFDEYKYDNFVQWINSLNSESIENLSSYFPAANFNNFKDVLSELIPTKIQLTENYNIIYQWVGNNEVWWLSAFQLIIIIFIFLRVEFNAEKIITNIVSLNHEDHLTNIRNNFNQSYMKKIVSSLLVPSEFNISLWIILFSLIIFIPQTVYIIKISLPNTSVHNFLMYSFAISNLFPNSNSFSPEIYNLFNYLPADRFAIMYLPIIGLAIVTIMILTFIFIILTKPNISRFGFFSLYTLYFIFSLISLVFFLVSQLQLQDLVDYWNDNLTSIIPKLTNHKQISYFWINHYELITSGILSFALLSCGSIIVLSHISKIRQKTTKIII